MSTRNRSLVVAALLVVGACRRDPPPPTVRAPVTAPAGDAALPWLHDDPAVLDFASHPDDVRPVFVDLWAPWCHTCISMQKTVFKDPALLARADEVRWLAVDTDRPENAGVTATLAISFWPTFVVVGKDGPIARHQGAATVAQILELLDAARAASAGDGGASAAMAAKARAAALALRGDDAAAAVELRQALDAGGPSWPGRFATRVELLTALTRSGQDSACLDVALAHLDDMGSAGSASVADFVGVAQGCVAGQNDARVKAWHATMRTAENPIARVLADPAARLSADDQSDALRILRDAAVADGRTRYARALAERQRQILDEAVAATDDPELQAGYAWPRAEVYAFLGRGEELLPELARLEIALPNAYDPPYRAAWLLHTLGRHDEALAKAARALDLVYGPRKMRAWLLMASIEEKRGSVDGQRRAYLGVLDVGKGLGPADARRAASALAQAKEKLDALPRPE